MKSYEDIKLLQTCFACPEQYDAYFDGKEVGYLRLRWGNFTADFMDETVYTANPNGDGIFESEEREFYLTEAKKAIFDAMTSGEIRN